MNFSGFGVCDVYFSVKMGLGYQGQQRTEERCCLRQLIGSGGTTSALSLGVFHGMNTEHGVAVMRYILYRSDLSVSLRIWLTKLRHSSQSREVRNGFHHPNNRPCRVRPHDRHSLVL